MSTEHHDHVDDADPPRYSDTTRCPDCGQPLPPFPDTCPACDLPLTGPLAVDLARTLSAADTILARLRASAHHITPEPDPHTEVGPPPLVFHHDRRRGLPAASMPTILLGLGALCLLVAAVTFLAVAWSSLGIGGRTAVLGALTLTAGAAGSWLGRRGLRVAAEALTVVAFGLLTLDVIGADNANWLGDLSASGLVGAVGAVMMVVGLSWALTSRTVALATPQLAAVTGAVLASLGAYGHTTTPDAETAVTIASVVGLLALTALGRATGLRLLPVVALVPAGLWWATLVVDGLARAASHATLTELWFDLHAWPLVAAALIPVAGVAVRRTHPLLARAGASGAAVLGTLAVAMPALDNSSTTLALAVLTALLTWSAALLLIPRTWSAVATAPLVLALATALVLVASLVLEAVRAVLLVGIPFTRDADTPIVHADPLTHPGLLVPLTFAVLLAGAALTRSRGSFAGVREHAALLLAVLGVAGVCTAALYSAPLAMIVVGLAVVAAGLVAAALSRTTVDGTAYATVAALVGGAAVAVALPSSVLTVVALAVLVASGAAVAVLGRFPQARPGAEMLLPVSVAALLWTILEVAAVDPALRGAPVLFVVLAGALGWPRPTVEACSWMSGGVAAAVAVSVADDMSTALALHLTLAGALVTVSSLMHASRRRLGWGGGLLLASATWVRLSDLGVDEPEAYTLPSAVALVLVGLWHLSRNPDASTRGALGPGLVLATVPSLLVVLAGDPVSLRALLLGSAALGLVLVGGRLRWSAPVTVGGVVGGLLVVRELAPYAGETPQWVLIGLAGTVLTVVGVTWESRLRDLRRTTAYLTRLR